MEVNTCNECAKMTAGKCTVHGASYQPVELTWTATTNPAPPGYSEGFADGFSRAWVECWDYVRTELNKPQVEEQK